MRDRDRSLQVIAASRIMFRIGLALASVLSLSSARADPGIYLGISGGYSSVDGNAHSDSGIEVGLVDDDDFLPFLEIVEAGIDDVAFDDSDASGRLFAGYSFNDYLSLELGVERLGKFESDDQWDIAEIDIVEYGAGARFRYPMTPKLAAIWRGGVTYADFGVDGEAEVLFLIPDCCLYVDREAWSAPDDELGWMIAFGFEWSLTPRTRVELSYNRHDTQVLKVDNLSLGVTFALKGL